MPQLTDIPSSPYGGTLSTTLSGVDNQRTAFGVQPIMEADKARLPKNFPIPEWTDQAVRYMDYWGWFTGIQLEEQLGETSKGEKILKFPLRINTIRNFARKHAALLFGETPENQQVLVRSIISPKRSLHPDQAASQKEKDLSKFYQNLVMETWAQSDGSTIMMENGVLSQFLGGCFFQIEYQPWRTDLLIPIMISNIVPDFVLPVWGSDKKAALLEAWVHYRIPAKTAELEYGMDVSGLPYVNYTEHWTRNHYSIYLDNKPLTSKMTKPDGTVITQTFDNLPNPFGFVPITYIPRLREGSFYGSSIVPDLQGLTLELNGRASDWGSVVRHTAHRKWLGRNIAGNIKLKQFDNGEWYSDLGMKNPSVDGNPELWAENPPNLSSYVKDNVDFLWSQILRDGSLTDVHFGEDEGSQRSAETLKTRFWSSTVVARMQRIHWEAGLNQMARQILDMMAIKAIVVNGLQVPLNVSKEYDIQQAFSPMVARDREAVINEVNTLSAGDRMSLRRALEALGDVRDLDEEEAAIWAELTRKAELEAIAKGSNAETEPSDKEASPSPNNSRA